MNWAVEIQKSRLDKRNLVDLLDGLGFQLVGGMENEAIYAPYFDDFATPAQVWTEAIKIRDAFTGPAAIDPEFALGAVIDFSAEEPKRHFYLEVKFIHMKMTVGTPELTVLPPANLSPPELKNGRKSALNKNTKQNLIVRGKN